jgi:hypothetical protein
LSYVNRDGSKRTLVIVEGASDQLALDVLARRLGLDLEADGVSIVPIGGAHSIGRFLASLAPTESRQRLAGLCDVGEEGAFQRAVELAGLGSNLTRDGMEQLGFYVCDADLEDELIRALGVAEVERVIEELGDLQSLRSFQRQPAQRGRAPEAQLRRFMGTRSGRKAKYARALVGALDLARIPRPLDLLLAGL